MARIAWIVPSINVFNNPDGELVIDSPLTFLELETLPNNFSFNVSFGIIELEELKKYSLLFEMLDPEMNSIFKTEVNIDNNELIKAHPDKEFLNVFVSNAHLNNFKFKKQGIHTIQLEIDKDISKACFNVIKRNHNNE